MSASNGKSSNVQPVVGDWKTFVPSRRFDARSWEPEAGDKVAFCKGVLVPAVVAAEVGLAAAAAVLVALVVAPAAAVALGGASESRRRGDERRGGGQDWPQ